MPRSTVSVAVPLSDNNIWLTIIITHLLVWFEAFPLVYNDIYHFSLGESGLPFIGLLVSACITGAGYLTYNYYVIERDFKRTGTIIPESRLVIALFAAPFGPISLFIFGTSSIWQKVCFCTEKALFT